MSQTTTGGFTVSTELVRGIVDCAGKCGLPQSRFSDLINLDSPGKPAASPPTRYSGEVIVKLWDRIRRETGDPIIGYRMALHASTKTFGALGQILPRCATVLEACRQTARYSALASQGAHMTVSRDAGSFTVVVALPHLPAGEVSRTIIFWGLTNLSLIPLRLAGVDVRPSAVACAFPAPAPADLRVLREKFPFTFDSTDNRVVFDRRAGDLAIPSADADLHSLLAETMDRHLAALGPAASFEQGMLTVLRGMMNGNMPTLASLSRRSGMSQRTLQRRLAESNTSFQRLLRQVLHEASDDLLAREDLSHGEIAFLLGYSEESAFSRAYRSWTGHPPGDARAVRASAPHI
jgi:AraC-like DNA-binding protein